MKKIILKSIFAICIVVSFTSCEFFDDLFGGGKEKEKTDCLTGSWENYNSEVLTFNSNKTGQLNSPDTTYNFTYKTENEKIIFIYNKETARNDRRNEIDRSDTLSYSCNCPNLKIDNKEWHRKEGSPCNDESSSRGGGGGGGSDSFSKRLASGPHLYMDLSGPGMPTVPPSTGIIMVYFKEFCVNEGETVTVYVGNWRIAKEITQAAGENPRFGDERAVYGNFDAGTYPMFLGYGGKRYPVADVTIQSNRYVMVPFTLPCE